MDDIRADATLEGALEALERDADAAVRSLAAALKEAKKAKAAASSGQLRDLRQAMDGAVRLADEAVAATRDLRASWTFDEQSHFASGAYTKEVLAVAAEQGVKVFESDDRILCYPAIIEASATDTTVVIDKKKDRRVRPSVLVRTLKALQSRPPKFKAESFLESLAVAYDLVVAKKGGRPGSPQKLTDIYAVLTVLPGSAREYTKQELARDLYLLDQSGKTVTKAGRTLQLPASALTRSSGVLTTVTRTGQEKVYAGISFEDGAR
ncbi:MAG: hypothetical protein M3503_00770 [Actinomycetota bacterium]|nr:hypothetical protein [Actinomycetota bacterium]